MEQDKDGNYPAVHPFASRITKDRRSSYVYVDYNIKKSEWNNKAQNVKSSYQHSKHLNAFLSTKRAEANDHSLELGEASSRTVKQEVKPKGGVTRRRTAIPLNCDPIILMNADPPDLKGLSLIAADAENDARYAEKLQSEEPL